MLDCSLDWSLNWLWAWLWAWGGTAWSLDTGEVTSKETSLVVGSVEWVDEGVDTGAVSAGWDSRLLSSQRRVGVETSSVGVELEVSVGWVVWVDEWVSVGVDWGFVNEDLLRLGNWLLLSDWELLGLGLGSGNTLLDWLSNWLNWFFNSGKVGVESGGVQTIGAIWNVGTVKDSETVFTSGVFDSDGVTVITDVRVLPDSFAIQSGFFSENDAVFSGKGGSCTTVSGVESLFFQDLGGFWVNKLGGANGQNTT